MSWEKIIKDNNLDISVISLSKLTDRIDAEYYKPKYLQEEGDISKHLKQTIGDLAYVTDGQHGYHEEDEDSDIRFLTAKNARNWFADGENVIRVAKWVDEKNKRSSLQVDDLILSTRGTVGLCAIVGHEILPAQIDQDVARICINENSDISPEFLVTYLNSTFGQDWMIRNSAGNVQQGLSLDKVRKIPVPVPSKVFQNRISTIILSARNKSQEGVFLHKEAEKMLSKELNLDNHTPSELSVSVRDLVECLRDDRFDAEYWQPEYDAMEKAVSKVTQKELSEIVSVSKGVEVGSEAYDPEGKPFIRVSDFSIYGIEDVEKKISPELYEELKDKYTPKKGEVLFTKDGTIGLSYALHEDTVGILSGAFLRLKPTIKINTDYLALVLNSLYCKTQIERMSGGAIIAHLKPESAKKIKIPLLSDAKQEEIADKVSTAFRMRKEAKELLEKAKRAVEIFVEKDEKEALKILS